MNSDVMCITILGLVVVLLSQIRQLRNDIAHMQSTLNRISKQAGVPDIVTKDVKDELRVLISQGKMVEAIKRYRKLTGLGLKEAKEYIDQLRAQESE